MKRRKKKGLERKKYAPLLTLFIILNKDFWYIAQKCSIKNIR